VDYRRPCPGLTDVCLRLGAATFHRSDAFASPLGALGVAVVVLIALVVFASARVSLYREEGMNIRRLLLDVDKAMERPSVLDIAAAVEAVPGVQAANVTVTDIDVETVGMDVTIEGDNIDFAAIESAIVGVGAAMHSIDEVAVGARIIERVPRAR
jgi:uncharacterized protein